MLQYRTFKPALPVTEYFGFPVDQNAKVRTSFSGLRKPCCIPSQCPPRYISYRSLILILSFSLKKSLEGGSAYMPQGLLSFLLLCRA